jgi:hypothetical protein
VPEGHDFASRCTGDTRRDDLLGMILALLDQVDENVIASSWTRAGERVDGATARSDVLFPNDFDEPVVPLYVPELKTSMTEGTWMACGIVEALPPDHPWATRIGEDDLYILVRNDGRHHALVLGPCDARQPGKPRHYYTAPTVLRYTAMLARLQHEKICAKTLNEISDWEFALVSKRRSVDRGFPPRRQPDPVTTPRPPTIEGSWRQRVGVVLEVMRSPSKWLVTPPAGTSVDDLLAARTLLGVSEDQPEPNKEAATRLASRTCGEARRVELVDLTVAFVRQLDAQVARLREAAQLWSAQKMSEVTNA